VVAAGSARGLPALSAFAPVPSGPPDAFPWLVLPRQALVLVAVGLLLSVGAADSKTAAHATTEVVLEKADKALYRAKRDGRDRVSA
jgi:hypothetical protein